MSYLNFNKEELINLEYSLSKEILRTNRSGAYASYTLVGCNTRKYHGLLICPIEEFNGRHHVLLNSLDLSIVYDSSEFNLGIHKYGNEVYNPRGHKYVQDFQAEGLPQIYYRIGGVRILKESLLVEKEQQILIRYTFLEADKPLKIKFTPFMSCRYIHSLSKANMDVNTKVEFIANGINSKMYDGFPGLYMQFSRNVEFVQVPDWYYNVEYTEEQKRGYEHCEDLFVPGYFETHAKEGDSIIFSASTKEIKPGGLKKKFEKGINKRIPRDTFKNCLLNSAEQFIVKTKKATEIKAGYHWTSSRSRDTFISLPGLTLPGNDIETFINVIDTQVAKLKNGLFPSKQEDGEEVFNSADSSLWFIWALQQLHMHPENETGIWDKYGKVLKKILAAFEKGTLHSIKMQENGLIAINGNNVALTWMDSYDSGKPVTPRNGADVEINALWYNAVCFCLELAKKEKDKAFIKKWKDLPERIEKSFNEIFWSSDKSYLADNVNGVSDWSIRPNQIIAASLPYSPLSREQKDAVIDTVRKHLLTPRGLRSLAPQSVGYKGRCSGNERERDNSYHQGTVWPWLLEHYCEAYLLLHKKSGLAHIKKILSDYEEVMNEHGIGSISEIYDGDPPHAPRGTISQAWSVAALLRIIDKVENLESI